MLEISRALICALAGAIALASNTAPAGAIPSGLFGASAKPWIGDQGSAVRAGHRRYRDYDDWDYDDDEWRPRAYAPRVYGYPPPSVIHDPPYVYDWVPQRPSSCGKYRYWTGDHCADARYRPPYVGPRWY